MADFFPGDLPRLAEEAMKSARTYRAMAEPCEGTIQVYDDRTLLRIVLGQYEKLAQAVAEAAS